MITQHTITRQSQWYVGLTFTSLTLKSHWCTRGVCDGMRRCLRDKKLSVSKVWFTFTATKVRELIDSFHNQFSFKGPRKGPQLPLTKQDLKTLESESDDSYVVVYFVAKPLSIRSEPELSRWFLLVAKLNVVEKYSYFEKVFKSSFQVLSWRWKQQLTKQSHLKVPSSCCCGAFFITSHDLHQ